MTEKELKKETKRLLKESKEEVKLWKQFFENQEKNDMYNSFKLVIISILISLLTGFGCLFLIK